MNLSKDEVKLLEVLDLLDSIIKLEPTKLQQFRQNVTATVVSVEQDDEITDVCDECLEDRIEELQAEIDDLQEELAERQLDDLLDELEQLREENAILRQDNHNMRVLFNRHLDTAIGLLENEKYDI